MQNDYTFFEEIPYKSLRYVHEAFLSTPFSDLNAPRGTYISKSGSYRSYPSGQALTKDPSEVYRPNHGLAHNVRVTAKVRDVTALYADAKNNKNPLSRKYFEELNEDEQRQKLEIAGSFYVACRGSEAGFDPAPNSPYQRYRQASSDAFYTYAKKLTKPNGEEPLYTEEELERYRTVVRDPYFNKDTDLPALNSNNEKQGKIAAAKAVLSSCHALDLARCFHVEKMNHKIIEVVDPLGENASDQARQQAIALFAVSEIQHILTGNKVTTALDHTNKKFIEDQNPEKRFLFRLCGTNPEIAIRCVSLSKHIRNIDIAKTLAVSLNRHALNGASELKVFLTRVENCFADKPTEKLEAIFEEEKKYFSNTSTGRIFKTIRNDEADFWDDFASELVNPSIDKPELRGTKNKNTDIRKPYTVKLKKGEYQIVPTNKAEKRKISDEEYNEQDKKTFTRHQSTSYSNYQAGYNPPCFGHNRFRNELLVGVSFDPADCQFKRIMMYDSGTIGRPYDFDSIDKAKKFIEEKTKRGLYHTTLQSLQETGLTTAQNQHNEVMAKLQWTAKSSITVFSDNLESRLLAQIRALDLKNRFQEKFPGTEVTIPITIYPEFSAYTPEHQALDREAAKENPELEKYMIALDMLEKKSPEKEGGVILTSASVNALKIIKKINKATFESFVKQISINHIDTKEKLVLGLSIVNESNPFIYALLNKIPDIFKIIASDEDRPTIEKLIPLLYINKIILIDDLDRFSILINEWDFLKHNALLIDDSLKYFDINQKDHQFKNESEKNIELTMRHFILELFKYILHKNNDGIQDPYLLLKNLYLENIFDCEYLKEITQFLMTEKLNLKEVEVNVENARSRGIFSELKKTYGGDLKKLYGDDRIFRRYGDNELLRVVITTPWASLNDKTVAQLFLSIKKSAAGKYQPHLHMFFYLEGASRALNKLIELGVSDLNPAYEFFLKAGDYQALDNYVATFLYLKKNNLLEKHLENLKGLSDTSMFFLANITEKSTNNKSNDFFPQAFPLCKKIERLTFLEREFLKRLSRLKMESPIETLTIGLAIINKKIDGFHDVFYTITSLIEKLQDKHPANLGVFLKLISSHKEPKKLIDKLEQILYENESKQSGFFSKKNHPDILVEYLYREYIENKGSSFNGIFSKCRHFSEAISALESHQNNYKDDQKKEKSASYKTLVLLGGLENLKAILGEQKAPAPDMKA